MWRTHFSFLKRQRRLQRSLLHTRTKKPQPRAHICKYCKSTRFLLKGFSGTLIQSISTSLYSNSLFLSAQLRHTDRHRWYSNVFTTVSVFWAASSGCRPPSTFFELQCQIWRSLLVFVALLVFVPVVVAGVAATAKVAYVASEIDLVFVVVLAVVVVAVVVVGAVILLWYYWDSSPIAYRIPLSHAYRISC